MKRIILLLIIPLFLPACESVPKEKLFQAEGASSENSKLLEGWNTWNNPSVLSHVLMPSGLNLQFLLRKRRRGPYWLENAYIASPKYNFPEKIEPKAHAYDGSYTELHIEWEGVSATVQSAHDDADILILYTPDEEVEQENHILIMRTGFLWNKKGQVEKIEDDLIASSGAKNVRIRSIGEQLHTPLPINSSYLGFSAKNQVAIYTGRKRTLEEIRNSIRDREIELIEYTQKFGELAPAYEALQSVIAWNQFYDAFNDRAIASVSRIWNEAWGAYIIFDWDTYFIALMAALDNKELAYSNVFAITNAITDDGFIPNVKSTYLRSNDRSQPPVGSMCVKLIYDQHQEKWFLEEVYDNLLRWNRWWAEHRDNQGYLSWGSNPHPEGMSPHTKQAAKWESGLDNSPLFDEAEFNDETHMLDLASVGLMGLYIADCKYLAAISDELGKTEEAKQLRKRALQYSLKLEELWDEESGIYRDKNLRTGKFSAHLAPTNFYPLLGGVPSTDQVKRMVNEHLLNENEFMGEWMIPSISRNDLGYQDNSYWRGRIWAPMNFLVYMGLRNYKGEEARKIISDKSLKLIMKSWDEKRRIHENYNSETGEGDDVRNSDPFYAWGALLGFIPLIEEGFFDIKDIPL